MFFEEQLDDLINECIAVHGRDGWREKVMDALERKLDALRRLEPEPEPQG